jgi:hypothetical protein
MERIPHNIMDISIFLNNVEELLIIFFMSYNNPFYEYYNLIMYD